MYPFEFHVAYLHTSLNFKIFEKSESQKNNIFKWGFLFSKFPLLFRAFVLARQNPRPPTLRLRHPNHHP